MKRTTSRTRRAAVRRAPRPNPVGAVSAREEAAMAAGAHVVRYLRRVAADWQDVLRDPRDPATTPPRHIGRFVALHNVRAFLTGQRVPHIGSGRELRESLVDHAGEMSLQAAFARVATVLREAAAGLSGDEASTLRAVADYAQFGRTPSWARAS